jgi:dihydroorotase
VLRRALQYQRLCGGVIALHEEDPELSGGGVMHEGVVSAALGLEGIPSISESTAIARDAALAGYEDGRIHVQHLSARESVGAVRAAKAAGVRVSAEVTPHHLTLTDEAVRDYDPKTKMYPPLRTADDVAAVRQALHDGTIDAIATDHAPHDIADKEVEFDQAPVGIIGLETALPLTLRLVREGVLSLAAAIATLTCGPARVLGLAKGTLQVGADADVTLIDPRTEYMVDRREFRSKARNSPFHGWSLQGRAIMTICAGKVVHTRAPERVSFLPGPERERRTRGRRGRGSSST